MKIMSYAEAINEALKFAMAFDQNVVCYGLGINDPKAIFNTTKGLVEEFGPERVFDMPTAENAMLGIGIGASIGGLRPIMIHQRLDFFLLSMDQLVNTAAKWFYMFGGQQPIPITIRLIVGRGWGQGPTHSQSLQALFAHIPGLKVIMPATPEDAKAMLIESIFDDNPVLFIEHRWLHHQVGEVSEEPNFRLPINKAKINVSGNDVTIVALSYQVIEALRAVKLLEQYGINCEVIDMVSVNPIDWQTITTSVKKTGRIVCVDTSVSICSVMSEVVAHVSIHEFQQLKSPPVRISRPFLPEGASFSLTKNSYTGALEIVEAIAQMMKVDIDTSSLYVEGNHDVPGEWFKGPF